MTRAAASKNIAVTGANGFIGSNTVEYLRGRDLRTVGLARGDAAEGATTVDFEEMGDLVRHLQGTDTVIHCAGYARQYGSRQNYISSNVQLTKRVLSASVHAGVRNFLYMSSASVLFTAKGIAGRGESAPLAIRSPSRYVRSKIRAEQLVGNFSLNSIVLRPHLVWGPGDRLLLPELMVRASEGRLARIGSDDPLIDSTHIGNLLWAIELALARFQTKRPDTLETFLVTDGEPISLWSLLESLFEVAGIELKRRSVPYPVAYVAGCMFELAAAAGLRRDEPLVTRFLVEQFSKPHWFDISASQARLGYQPCIGRNQAIARLRELGPEKWKVNDVEFVWTAVKKRQKFS